MEFRLVYEGNLPAAGQSSTRSKEKHEIRRQLHPQLKQLWSVQRPLLGINPEKVAERYTHGGFRFIPIVNSFFGWVCDLEVLFLRREEAGALVHGGDIDNRIKVLFDGLKMIPLGKTRGYSPAPDEDPFFVLLEDDNLITSLTVTTDRLLRPLQSGHHEHDVMLIIKVLPRIANNARNPYVMW